jgi:hypothetical protein
VKFAQKFGRALIAALAGAACLTVTYNAWAADAIPLPGYWETTNTWVVVFHFKTVERKCFTAADVSGVLSGPSNAHYACRYPVREVHDGHLLLNGTCVEKHGQVAQISAEGAYAPTSFELTARLSTKIAGVPLHGTGITKGRRISDTCPSSGPKAAESGN